MKSLMKLAALLKPYWQVAMLGPLLMILEVAMDMVQPRLMQRIVDIGIAQQNTSLILHTSALMILLAFFGIFGGFGGGFFAVRAAQLFGAALRSKLYRKVQSLSFGNLDRIGTGELITRLTNDVTQVQEALFVCLHIMVRTPLTIVGSITMATLTSAKLALMFFVLIPLLVAVLFLIIKLTYKVFGSVQQRVDSLNTVMLENFAGVRVVKAFVRGLYENRRFDKSNVALKNNMVTALRIAAMTMPSTMLILNIGIVAVIWFGGIQVSQGTLMVGQIIAFINYITFLVNSVMMLGMLITRVSRAAASADRLMAILKSEPEVQEHDRPLVSFDFKGRVVFDKVSFDYGGASDKAVLKDISFVAEPGQMVAILGATGAGKSSLINLIPRFYDVTSGQISIDGVDVHDFSKVFLRENIGIAMQEVVLFSGTIRENIAFGRSDATMDEILAASRAAQAHDFISGFPEGYETVLGQRGVNLSGGQKQRIAIARALITQPKILILDDSTSAIDVETEARLQEALVDLMKDRTSIVIAQRISTVLNADKIIVLDNGVIAAEGTHRELLAESPIYGEIYASQLGSGAVVNG
jgi:ATP-binding cassette subfamily B protein